MRRSWILASLALVLGSCATAPDSGGALAKFDVATAPSSYAGLMMCEQWLAQEASLPKIKGAEETFAQEASIETAVQYCLPDHPDQTGTPSQALAELIGPKPGKYAAEIRRQAAICHRQLQTIYADCRV